MEKPLILCCRTKFWCSTFYHCTALCSQGQEESGQWPPGLILLQLLDALPHVPVAAANTTSCCVGMHHLAARRGKLEQGDCSASTKNLLQHPLSTSCGAFHSKLLSTNFKQLFSFTCCNAPVLSIPSGRQQHYTGRANSTANWP